MTRAKLVLQHWPPCFLGLIQQLKDKVFYFIKTLVIWASIIATISLANCRFSSARMVSMLMCGLLLNVRSSREDWYSRHASWRAAPSSIFENCEPQKPTRVWPEASPPISRQSTNSCSEPSARSRRLTRPDSCFLFSFFFFGGRSRSDFDDKKMATRTNSGGHHVTFVFL